MADWTSLPDATFDEGKPIRGVDGLALRDNPAAIAQGAAGAPRMQPMAFSSPLVAGTVTRFLDTEEYSNPLDSYRTVFHQSFSQSGTVQVRFEHARTPFGGSSNGSRARVLVNNISILDVTINDGSMTLRSVEATISYNSVLRVEHRRSGSNTDVASRIRNIELRTNGGVVWLWPKGMRFPA